MYLLLFALLASAQEVDPPPEAPPAETAGHAVEPDATLPPDNPDIVILPPKVNLQDQAAPELIPGREPPPEAVDPDAPPPKRPFDAGIVWNPIELFLPMLVSEEEAIEQNDPTSVPVVELALEASLAPHHALQILFGIGWRSFGEYTYRRTQIGGRYRAYFLRPYDGLLGGLQVKRYDVETRDAGVNWTTVGGVLGYKHILPKGFTVEAVGDAGVKWGTNVEVAFDWHVNLALGWSFRLRAAK